MSIQSANEHTLKHDRFLLASVKLSASSSSQETPSPSNSAPDSLFDVSHKKTLPLSSTVSKVGVEVAASIDASSISEYLIETLPGWQVEDFLDSYFVPFGFCKVCTFLLSLLSKSIDSTIQVFLAMVVPVLVKFSPIEKINFASIKNPN
ncbi:B-box zinc finger protein 21-like [Vigna angularis]|uniref:B-box zinc finger protein 21-like n=1 Tax=Phaseolus angularis TaxID=3914 RepID=UPI0022B3D94F|nr:B-box zinc finger protein 21-like [Vigna angularis]